MSLKLQTTNIKNKLNVKFITAAAKLKIKLILKKFSLTMLFKIFITDYLVLGAKRKKAVGSWQ